jgi:hypothetical protein
MLCAERRAATRRISADALDPPPGDFCREVVIVRARFGFALVAQLDRASDFESEGREFESLRARQGNNSLAISVVREGRVGVTPGLTIRRNRACRTDRRGPKINSPQFSGLAIQWPSLGSPTLPNTRRPVPSLRRCICGRPAPTARRPWLEHGDRRIAPTRSARRSMARTQAGRAGGRGKDACRADGPRLQIKIFAQLTTLPMTPPIDNDRRRVPAPLLLRPRAAHSGSVRAPKTRAKLRSRRPMAPLARAVEVMWNPPVQFPSIRSGSD